VAAGVGVGVWDAFGSAVGVTVGVGYIVAGVAVGTPGHGVWVKYGVEVGVGVDPVQLLSSAGGISSTLLILTMSMGSAKVPEKTCG